MFHSFKQFKRDLQFINKICKNKYKVQRKHWAKLDIKLAIKCKNKQNKTNNLSRILKLISELLLRLEKFKLLKILQNLIIIKQTCLQ